MTGNEGKDGNSLELKCVTGIWPFDTEGKRQGRAGLGEGTKVVQMPLSRSRARPPGLQPSCQVIADGINVNRELAVSPTRSRAAANATSTDWKKTRGSKKPAIAWQRLQRFVLSRIASNVIRSWTSGRSGKRAKDWRGQDAHLQRGSLRYADLRGMIASHAMEALAPRPGPVRSASCGRSTIPKDKSYSPRK